MYNNEKIVLEDRMNLENKRKMDFFFVFCSLNRIFAGRLH